MNINDSINGSNLIYNYKLRTRVSMTCGLLTYARIGAGDEFATVLDFESLRKNILGP